MFIDGFQSFIVFLAYVVRNFVSGVDLYFFSSLLYCFMLLEISCLLWIHIFELFIALLYAVRNFVSGVDLCF